MDAELLNRFARAAFGGGHVLEDDGGFYRATPSYWPHEGRLKIGQFHIDGSGSLRFDVRVQVLLAEM